MTHDDRGSREATYRKQGNRSTRMLHQFAGRSGLKTDVCDRGLITGRESLSVNFLATKSRIIFQPTRVVHKLFSRSQETFAWVSKTRVAAAESTLATTRVSLLDGDFAAVNLPRFAFLGSALRVRWWSVRGRLRRRHQRRRRGGLLRRHLHGLFAQWAILFDHPCDEGDGRGEVLRRERSRLPDAGRRRPTDSRERDAGAPSALSTMRAVRSQQHVFVVLRRISHPVAVRGRRGSVWQRSHASAR